MDEVALASSAGTAQQTSDIRVFLFAEVRGYTRFSQERGDEVAARLVERFAGIARQVVDAQGGKVLELRGDEAMGVFGSARRALRAAVELQERYLAEAERDPSLPLQVSIGLDAGEATPFEGGYRGRALNLAARLKDQARPGQTLASEAVIHIAGQMDGLVYIERGLVHLKGLDLPVRAIEVVGEGQQVPAVQSPDEPDLRIFLFADIKGSMDIFIQHGDAAGVDLYARYARVVEERIHARGGRVLEIGGDEAYAVFVSPRQAVRAAIELEEDFDRLFGGDQRRPLALRVGLEAGEAIPFRGKYTGSTVVLAARICGLAGPGEVLIGETLSRLVRRIEGILFVDRGQVQVRGLSDPVHIVQVVRKDAVTQVASEFTEGADASSDLQA